MTIAARITLNVLVPGVSDSGYPIRIGSGFLSSLWPEIEAQWANFKPFLVTDANLVRAGLVDQLLGKRNFPMYIITPPGEGSKHIQTIAAIAEAMEQAFLGRDSLIVALGGGTVGDIAGFAAAIYKRGVPVVQIPTTTVAQADSSVGGKTGVDSTFSKNAFGCFWHPAAVYVDVGTLATLDDRQFRAGLVESVKHAAIADVAYFDYLEKNTDAILSRNTDVLEHIAYNNCRIKAAVVTEDPTEKNRRRTLNYGHTVGHAVESASGFALLHGEAVAIGMIAAGLLEEAMGLINDNRLIRIRRLLEKLGQPTRIPKEISKDSLIDLLKRDKKSVAQWPRFVLLERLGCCFCKDGQWALEVTPKYVQAVIDSMR
jgi:3-dehydroquinate synthase